MRVKNGRRRLARRRPRDVELVLAALWMIGRGRMRGARGDVGPGRAVGRRRSRLIGRGDAERRQRVRAATQRDQRRRGTAAVVF